MSEAIRGLTEDQAAALLPVVRLMQQPAKPSREYDESEDVAIGLITGPTDIASRVEEILYPESRSEE